jgi:hypothetical protein
LIESGHTHSFQHTHVQGANSQPNGREL